MTLQETIGGPLIKSNYMILFNKTKKKTVKMEKQNWFTLFLLLVLEVP